MSRLSNIKEEYLECRDLKHAWTWSTDFVDYKDDGKVVSVIRALQCSRCRTIRYDEYAPKTFDKIRSRYSYPGEYHIPGDPVRMNEVRKELYARHQTKRKK